MSGPETAVQELLRKLIANEIRLYDEHGNLIEKNDPEHTDAVKTSCARMHRLLDECLSSLSPEQFADVEALNKAIRDSFQGLSVDSGGKPGVDWGFDLGKGELAVTNIVPGQARATLPVYTIAMALAGSRVALKLVRWERLAEILEDAPDSETVRLNPEDGLDYVWIPPGAFLMGATPGDEEAYAHEKPQHPVAIDQGLWISRGPVTVAAYERYVAATGAEMPEFPEFNSGWENKDHPVVNVTWEDAVAYCEWAGGRLLTEAEWEYAARGGKENLKYPWGDDIGPKNANYFGSGLTGTSRVGSYPANGFGLHDMSGNVWEWTADRYDEEYYSMLSLDEATVAPQGPVEGVASVVRGGSWVDGSGSLRAAVRNWFDPGYRINYTGFRCVWEVLP